MNILQRINRLVLVVVAIRRSLVIILLLDHATMRGILLRLIV